jgi:protein-tyrosine phosphatase
MIAPGVKTRRRWLAGLLGVLIAGELAAVCLYVLPLAAAKWRASPDRLDPSPKASLAYLAAAATDPNSATATTRPANWAQPLAAPGLNNFYEVSPDLYRAARLTPEGAQQLKKLGIRTVVNLETLHSDRELLAGTGVNGVRISFKAWHPETDDMVAFLKVAADANLTPVLVHCQYGADRTGTMCAVYRVAVQGWDKPAAIDEMVHGGFGFHPDWQNLLEFIDHLDVPALKKKAGIEG